MTKSKSNLLTLLLAILGGVIATLLTIKHWMPEIDVGCSVLPGGGCKGALNSAYGHLGPIPTSILGLGMYLSLVGLCLLRSRHLNVLRDVEAANAAAYATAAAPSESEPNAAPPDMLSKATTNLRGEIRRLDSVIWLIALAGFGISWWLQYTALYVLCSFCPWCFGSAITISLIFLIASCDYLLNGRSLTGEQKLLAGVTAFISVLLLIVYAPALQQQFQVCGNQKTPRVIPSLRDEVLGHDPGALHIRGNPGAPYLIVEFADYQCPACREANATIDAILEKMGDKVRFAFRNYPLPMHVWGRKAAAAAEAAGKQGKFWEMHDLIYNNQAMMDAPDFNESRFDTFAKQLGLNGVQFARERTSQEIAERIQADLDAVQGHVEITPTFFVISPDPTKKDVTRIGGAKTLLEAVSDPHNSMWK